MPNIQEYVSPEADRGLRPDSGGQEAFAMEGRRVGAFYHQVGQDIEAGAKDLGGQIEQQQSFQEISHLASTGAQLHNTLDQSLNDTMKNADPNDPTTAAKWRDTILRPALQQYQEAPATKAGRMYALQHSNELQNFFNDKAIAYQSNVAGTAALMNNQSALNNAAAGAYNDPTSASLQRGTYMAGLEAAIKAGNMDSETASRLRLHGQEGQAQITWAAFRGMADKNPDEAEKQLAAGGQFAQYLTPEQQQEAPKWIESVRRAKETDSLRAEEEARRQKEDVSSARAGEYLTALGGANTAGPGFVDSWSQHVLTDTKLTPANRDSLQAMGARMAREKAEESTQGDPQTFSTMVHALTSGTKISDADVFNQVGIPHGLSMAQADFLTKIIHPKNEHDQLDTKLLDTEMGLWKQKGTIPGIAGATNPDSTQYTDMTNFYMPLIKQGLANGTSMADMLGPPDADHPNSIYRTRTIESFAPTAAQNVDHVAHSTKPEFNLLDQAKAAWDKLTDPAAGNGTVTTPIEGNTRDVYHSIIAPKPGQKSMDDLWTGK